MRRLVLLLLLWPAVAGAAEHWLLCPYDTVLEEDGWVRRNVLAQFRSAIRAEATRIRRFEPFYFKEVAGNRAVVFVSVTDNLFNSIVAAGCTEVTERNAQLAMVPARTPRIVNDVVTYDDADVTRDLIDQRGVEHQREDFQEIKRRVRRDQ